MAENLMPSQSHAANLYSISREQIHKAIKICQEANKFSDCVNQLRELLNGAKNQEVIISAVGGQSTGKSTFFNGLLQYPVLPTAEEVTSSCPVEIRRSDVPALEIFMVNQDGSEETLVTYENPRLSDDLFQQLKEYAVLCFNNNVIALDSLNYFCDVRLQKTGLDDMDFDAEMLQMNPDDPRQVITLMMIPLTAYVGQNASIAQVESEALVRSERTRLLDILIPHAEGQTSYAEKDYCLRLWWNSEILDQNLILVDLPGLGSVTEVKLQENEDDIDLQRLSHAQITTRYSQSSDSMLMLFDPQARKDDMDIALRSLLDGERMKRIIDKDSRFVVLLNKADTCGINIFTPAPKIHAILEGVNLPRIYPVSGLYGEYHMVHSGGIPVERTKLYRRMLNNKMQEWLEDGCSDAEIQQNLAELADRARKRLENNYRHEFAYQVFEQQEEGLSEARMVVTGQETISLERFMNEFIHDYAHRIQYLKTLDMVIGSGGKLDGVLKEIELRASIIDMMRKCGPDVAKAVMNSVFSAVSDALDDFSGKLSDIRKDLNQKTLEANTRIQEAKMDILKGFNQYENNMRSDISSTISGMKTNWNDGKAFLDKGSNRSALNGLLSRMKYSDFRHEPKSKDGMNKLDKAIADQKTTFDQGIQDLDQEYAKIPALCKQNMKDAFDKQKAALENSINALAPCNAQAAARKNQLETSWKLFQTCYQDVSQTVLSHINSVVADVRKDLKNNNRMDQEITTTSNRLEELFKAMDSGYRGACMDAVEKCKNDSFFKGDFLKVKKLEKSLQKPFVDEDWKNALMMVLDGILTHTLITKIVIPSPKKGFWGKCVFQLQLIYNSYRGLKDGYDGEKCHNERVFDALNDINKTGVASCNYIESRYPDIQDSTSDLSSKTAEELVKELKQLKDAYIEPLGKIFDPILKCIAEIPEDLGNHPQLSPTIARALAEGANYNAAIASARTRIDGYINAKKGD